LPTRKPTV